MHRRPCRSGPTAALHSRSRHSATSELAIPDCDEAIAADAAARSGIEAAGLCTEAAPAIVFGAKLQPVLAVADGVVTEVVDEPGGSTPISVTVTDEGGRSYVYSGFNDDRPGTDDGQAPAHLRLSGNARLGDTVRAGQVLGFMGDTDPLPAGVTRPDESTTAHVRVSMFELDGRAIDSYGPVIDALFRQTCTIAAGPWSLPENGSGHAEVTVEVADPIPEVDSQWVITETGQMTAAGWAAMINPQQSCESVPAEAFGPGAAGSHRHSGTVAGDDGPAHHHLGEAGRPVRRDRPRPLRPRDVTTVEGPVDTPRRRVGSPGQSTRRASSTRLIS